TTAEWQTHVGSFKVNPACQAPAQGTLQVNVTDCDSNLPLAGARVFIGGNLYGTSGAGGSFSTQLPPGVHNVSVTLPNYSVGVGAATVTDGGATVIDLCAAPSPFITPAGSALTAESCPPPTDAIDPGETVTVDLTLKNTGAANTSNLVATLLPTGGVTSPSGPESYGVVVAGGPSVTKSFTFTASGALACGDQITATLQLQDGPDDLGAVTYTFDTGALGAPTSASYSSGNLATALPDNTTVDIPINVADTGAVDDVNVRVRLNHTFDGDVEIRLVHPDGTVVLLSDNRGGSGDNYGAGANDCSGTHTVFDDGAAVAISAGTAPFAATFRPEQPLSALNGKATNGTWKLRITDTANLDTGTVGCVQLEINRRQRLCCPFAGGTPAVVAAPPADLTAESCAPANDAIDPEETVTVELPLKNNGTGPTTNLVATLLPGGGISPVTTSQNYGALSPVGAGSTASRPFTFVAQGACGSTVTATLQLQDGANNLGAVTFTFVLGAVVLNTTTHANAAPITILDTPRVGGIAPSSPYPSAINVSGVTGTVSKVSARLNNFSHTFPGDVDVLLVGPGGQKLMLMSDMGSGTDAVNATLTFDDTAPAIGAAVVTGAFRPTNSGTGDIFPAPAPAGPYPDPQLLSVFNGVNPNGTWSLYVVDDAGTDAGSITGGWELIITTEQRVCCDSPCTITPPANVVVNNDAGSCGAIVNYPAATVGGSCGVLSYSHPSGSFFPVGTTTVTITATRADSTTSTDTFTVTVNDAEGPSVSDPVASPSSLWPPNHKMRDVTVSYGATDNCTTPGAISCTLSVTSNEPVNSTDDGDTAPDWQVVNNHLVRLRAERSGSGSGRIYTITVTCTDSAGNQTVKTTTVTVPYSL
ncbi:MAG TPA: proprotein convertase P-domain-containing protein, partial [Pyrinomonadaceae bacterium]